MRHPIDPIVLATALLLGAKHHARQPKPAPTPEQLAVRAQRDERKAWNDEVERKKRAKKEKKHAQP
jgi:hypothetical protein